MLLRGQRGGLLCGEHGSGVPWPLCFLVRVRGGGAARVGVGIAPGGAVGGGCLDSWGVGGWESILCFPFRVTAGAMVGVRLDSSVVPFVLRMSKAAHDIPSCFQSGGIVGALGSIPVARREATTARIIPSEVKSARRVAMALRLSVGGKM